MSKTEPKPLKILNFKAENFKRLKVVEITPDDSMVIIAGRNSQGKTSVLDSIWATLGGGTAAKGTKKPIRDGEDHAKVSLDLGDLIVTRTWRGDNSTLTVTSEDGAKYASPQTVIESFMGKLSFDPLEFTKLSSKEQLSALLDLVDLPINLDELAQNRQSLYDERTDVGRNVKSLKGQLDGLGEVDDTVPNDEVSQADLLAEYEKFQRSNADLRHGADQLEVAKAKRQQLQEETILNTIIVDDLVRRFDGKALHDLDEMRAEIANAETTNTIVRRNKEINAATSKWDIETTLFNDLTEEIEIIDGKKANALAKAKFPVKGLGFTDEGVTFNGIPFSQASASEQIRVSLAMAMALNPRLRVIRILDGSLLDDDNLALIKTMAKDQNFQVWIERVGDGDGVGFVIEDGEVVI